jgi:hypothetical protein
MAIKPADLQEWSDLEQRRRDAQRELSTLRDRQKQLEDMFEAELRKSGKQQIKRGGFTLALQAGRASVSWAKEFLRACGEEAAQKIKDEAAKTSVDVFVIVPPEK